MFGALLKGLPWLAIVLGTGGGLITGAPLGWIGRDLVFNTIEKPLLTRTIEWRERDACTIRTMDAANRAEAAEREKQRVAREAALEAEERQSALRDAERVREIDQLNQEIEANEQRLRAEGRSCPLDPATRLWLRSQWGLPPAD